MGNCMSSNSEEIEQKKRSQMIDRRLEEDSRRLRRECKILLLGRFRRLLIHGNYRCRSDLLIFYRLWGERQVDNCQADENHTSKRLHGR